VTWLPPLRLVRTGEACRNCAFFEVRPVQIEAHLRGLNSLSSGFASVRSDDGLCMKHQRLMTAAGICAQFQENAQRTSA